MFYPFETVKPVLEEVNPFCLTRGKEQGSVEPLPFLYILIRQPGGLRRTLDFSNSVVQGLILSSNTRKAPVS
jgi:hypothetical protein